MTALPRVNGAPDAWRTRRDLAIKERRNSSFAQRQLELCVAREIRREIKAEKRERKSA